MSTADGTLTRIVVVGAGGLGSYLAAALAGVGHTVTAVARGEHGAAIRTKGLTVVTGLESGGQPAHSVHRVRCVERTEDAGPQDLALITVKAFSLDEVAPAVAALAAPGATVVPFLNGVDAIERLEAAGVPATSLLGGVAYLTAFRTAPGRVERSGTHGRLLVGAPNTGDPNRLERTIAAFNGTGIQVVHSDDIHRDLWLKMALVCALSALCGAGDSALGPLRTHPSSQQLQHRAVREVLAVAKAAGVETGDNAHASVTQILDGFPDDFYPSLVHDLRAGRATEIGALCGTIVRLGEEYGVDTPLHAMATWVIECRSRRAASGLL